MITVLAALGALTIAVSVPASFFFAGQARLSGELRLQARLYAREVADEAQRDPVLWNALADSAGGPAPATLAIARPPDAGQRGFAAERRRVFSGTGRLVLDVATGAMPGWPLATTRSAVMDGTSRLGEVELTRSLRPQLIFASVVACLSGAVGLLMFVVLRVAPLRMLATALRHASFLSAHDTLTGLPNRSLFHDRLEQALVQSLADDGRVAVFSMDLDQFKSVNEFLGHSAGDAVLKSVAVRLAGCIRPGDTLARLSSDEFGVIQTRIGRPQDAESLGRRLRACLDAPFDIDGQSQHVGISIGVSLSDRGVPAEADRLMKEADIALHEAKQDLVGHFCFFQADMSARLHDRQAMERAFRSVVAEEGLMVYYQPQIDLRTGGLIGAEALLRWDRQGHGMVPPDEFVGLAEDTGLIVPVGKWVLREACRRATNWPAHVSIAVNVSPVQLRYAGFCEIVMDAVQLSGLAAGRLELEITEGVLMQDTEETLSTLQKLRAIGVRLAMDDFGTGYASLAYLQKFCFDKIKIDRSFTRRLGQDANANAIIRAVVGITDALGVQAIAEGVETAAQAEALRSQGCFLAQGFLYGRPIPGEAFDALARNSLRSALPLPVMIATTLCLRQDAPRGGEVAGAGRQL